jgi:hypothetical protein
MTKKEKQRQVIIAATIWAACPKAGSFEEDEQGYGGWAVEDTCENLDLALRVLNGCNPIPDDIPLAEAEKLGKKLARGI